MRIQLIIILLVFPTLGYAQRKYTANQTVYCWAESGLNLRENPGINSKKILNIPNKSPVTIIDADVGAEYRDTLTKDKKFPLVISGNWIKVSYAGQTGYVFDGYLSRQKNYYDYFPDKPSKTCDTTLYFDTKPFKSTYALYTRKNGAYYKYILEDGCYSHHYYFPDISFEEGVMIMAELFKPDDFECPLKLKEIKGSDYYFENCTVTTLRQIRVTKTGIYIFTFDCT